MQTTLAPPLKGPGFNVQAWQEIYVELTTTKVKRKNYETLQMMSAWEAHNRWSLIFHQHRPPKQKYILNSTS
jgi:hypothetical protein